MQKSARRLERERKDAQKGMPKSGTLLPTEETIAPLVRPSAEIVQPKEAEEPREESESEEAARVLAKLKQMKGGEGRDELTEE